MFSDEGKYMKLKYLLLFAVFPVPAYAYLDPGSISLALQGFLAALAGLGATIGLWKNKVIGLFSRKHRKHPKSEADKPRPIETKDDSPTSL